MRMSKDNVIATRQLHVAYTQQQQQQHQQQQAVFVGTGKLLLVPVAIGCSEQDWCGDAGCRCMHEMQQYADQFYRHAVGGAQLLSLLLRALADGCQPLVSALSSCAHMYRHQVTVHLLSCLMHADLPQRYGEASCTHQDKHRSVGG